MSIQQSNGAVNLQAALNRLVKAGTVDPNILLKYSQNPPPDLGDKGALLVSLASSIVARNKQGSNASMSAPTETVSEQLQNKLAQSDQPQGIASLNPPPMMPSKMMAQAPQTKMEDQGVASLSIPDQMFSGQSMAAGGIITFDDGGDVAASDAAPSDAAPSDVAPSDVAPGSDLPSDFYMSDIQRSLMGRSPVRYTGATAGPAFASSSPYGTDMIGEMMRVSPDVFRYSLGVGRGTSPYAGAGYAAIRKEMGSPGYADGGIVAFAGGGPSYDPDAFYRMPIPKIPTADDLLMETQDLKSRFVDPDFYKKRKLELEDQTREDINESKAADKANILFKLAEGFGTTPGSFVRGAVAAGVKAGPAVADMNKNIIAAKRLNRAALNELEQSKYAESIGDFKTAAALRESARNKEFEAEKLNVTTDATYKSAKIKAAAVNKNTDFQKLKAAQTGAVNQFKAMFPDAPFDTIFASQDKTMRAYLDALVQNELEFYETKKRGPINVPVPRELLKYEQDEKDKNKNKTKTKVSAKETQAQYINRRKEETAKQKYPLVNKNYDQTSSDAGGNVIDLENAEAMRILEGQGAFDRYDTDQGL